MVPSNPEKSKTVKDFLRCMLRAWYDYVKEETNSLSTFVTEFTEPVLETEEQQSELMVSTMFNCWKRGALHPVARARRQRSNSNAPWVQRMIAPIKPRGWSDMYPLSEDRQPQFLSIRRNKKDDHVIGPRYLRIHTMPPECIRYGRNAVAPLASTAAKSSTTGGPHSSRWGNGGGVINSSSAPKTTTTSQCRRLMLGGRRCGHRYRRRRQRWGDGAGSGNGQHTDDDYFAEDYEEHSSSDPQQAGWATRGWEKLDEDNGGCPLTWDEMEPWEQRNACWVIQGDGDSGVANLRDPELVMREVESHLERYEELEERHRQALALCKKNSANRLFSAGPGHFGDQGSNNQYKAHSSSHPRSSTPTRTRTVGGARRSEILAGADNVPSSGKRRGHNGRCRRFSSSRFSGKEDHFYQERAMAIARDVIFGQRPPLSKASVCEDHWF